MTAPVTRDFWADAQEEAEYQSTRWTDEHDKSKSEAEWFWLVGWILGKAMRPGASVEKKRHRLRATAAVLSKWDQALADGSTP